MTKVRDYCLLECFEATKPDMLDIIVFSILENMLYGIAKSCENQILCEVCFLKEKRWVCKYLRQNTENHK